MAASGLMLLGAPAFAQQSDVANSEKGSNNVDLLSDINVCDIEVPIIAVYDIPVNIPLVSPGDNDADATDTALCSNSDVQVQE